MSTMPWEALAEAKRQHILSSIPAVWRIGKSLPSVEQQRDITGGYIRQFLDCREIEITETDAIGILQKTTTGKWSSLEVTKAFCHRAAVAHQLINCLHDIFVDAALQHASVLDSYFEMHKKPIGPLHGLPISMKDQFHLKGSETTMGYVGWIGTFEGERGTGKEGVFESQLATDLRELGAVFYCKTAVPPSLMTPETNNNIVGYLWNPKNRHICAGGSSGGEGALLSLRGSPLGFGSDIGGSIRVPASNNGVFGFKPSTGRLPYEGTPSSMDGQETIPCVVGPLATTIGSLQLVVKALLTKRPWLHDPLVIEMPWRSEQEQEVFDLCGKLGSSKKLSFGLFKYDGRVTPSPPLHRAMELVENALKSAGHEVIEWNPPSHHRGWNIAARTWLYDGGLDIHSSFGLSGEPVIPQISKVYGHEPMKQKQATDIAATNVAKRNYQKDYLHYWNSTADLTHDGQAVAAFIAPLAPYPGGRPGKYNYHAYSAVINLLDYSSAAIPVTTVDKKIDTVDYNFTPRNTDDQDAFDAYDPDLYDGSFVGLQVVGRRLQEEKTLALAELISYLLE